MCNGPEALRLCEAMAKLNNVADRLTTGSFCRPETLRSIPLGKRALIISDCEGYETELFTPAIAPLLAHHDLLIEAHDFVDIEISARLESIFEKSHNLFKVRSLDDIEKIRSCDYKELEGFDLYSKKALVTENRPFMEWLYMTPKMTRPF